MVKIRLARHGSKRRPFYHLVVADSESPRDGRFLEQVGIYDPRRPTDELRLELDRVDYWVGVGAQPTTRVKHLINFARRAAAVQAEGAAVQAEGEAAAVGTATEEAPAEPSEAPSATSEASSATSEASSATSEASSATSEVSAESGAAESAATPAPAEAPKPEAEAGS